MNFSLWASLHVTKVLVELVITSYIVAAFLREPADGDQPNEG